MTAQAGPWTLPTAAALSTDRLAPSLALPLRPRLRAGNVVVRVLVRRDDPIAILLNQRVRVAIARLLGRAVRVGRRPRLEGRRRGRGAVDADRAPLDVDQLDVCHTIRAQVLIGSDLCLIEVAGRGVLHDTRIVVGEGLRLLVVAALNDLLDGLLRRVTRQSGRHRGAGRLCRQIRDGPTIDADTNQDTKERHADDERGHGAGMRALPLLHSLRRRRRRLRPLRPIVWKHM